MSGKKNSKSGKKQMLKPFFSYFGSKFRMAKHYPKPIYPIIIEPFAGSAGYSTYYGIVESHLYEINPQLFELWYYLINQASYDDIMKLPIIGEFENIRDSDIPIGAKYLIGFLLNQSCSKPTFRPSSWAKEATSVLKGHPFYNARCSYWGKERRLRTANSVHLIKKWKIKEVDTNGYLEIPNIEATWFIDPPYQLHGNLYQFGSDYIDYKELGEWCKSRKGQVIVCEQEGADWMEWTGRVEKKRSTGYERNEMTEVFWYNTNA